MKTIQINDFTTVKEEGKQKKLLKELYDKFLMNDTTFHFFLEPQLIIRSSNEKIIAEIKQFLTDKKYLFEIYTYPDNKKEFRYGESHEPLKKYNKLFLEMFHALSVLYLTIPEKEHKYIWERAIHCALNMGFKNYWEEAIILSSYAIQRAVLYGSYLSDKK